MVSDLKTFDYKGCKIAAQKKLVFGKFCLTSRICLSLVLLSTSVKRCFVSYAGFFIWRKSIFLLIFRIIIVDILTVDILVASLVFVTFRKSGWVRHGICHGRTEIECEKFYIHSVNFTSVCCKFTYCWANQWKLWE